MGNDLAFEVTKGIIKFSMSGDLGKKLDRGNERVQRMLKLHMEYWAPRVETHMKVNAPWSDQTGNARNGLAARAFQERDNSGIVLYHQVPYGIWLEVKNSGQYAIIGPTIDVMGPQVMEDLKGKLSEMRL